MTKKDTADTKTGVSKVGLSGDIDPRLVSKRADRTRVPQNGGIATERPGGTEQEEMLFRKLFVYDAVFGLGIFNNNAADVTKSGGWSFPILTAILSSNDLEQKGLLGKDDIMMADTKDAATRDMKVLRISGENGQDHYLTGGAMDKFLEAAKGKGYTNFEGTTVGALQHRMITSSLDRAEWGGQAGLNPQLVARMQKDPAVAEYVSYAIKSAERAGIDGNMYANQLWQESRFNPRAVSQAGARGVCQMMPFHEGKFGLSSKEDFFDPYKSIDAGAQMMAGLTRQYGDQRLALVAYNGGGRAIDFVEKNLGQKTVSFEQWHGFMTERREQLGSAVRGAWHVETLGYVNNIAAPQVAAKTEGMKWTDRNMTVQPS